MARDLILDSKGNLFVTGDLRETSATSTARIEVYFGTGNPPARKRLTYQGTSQYLAKFSPTGQCTWDKIFGNISNRGGSISAGLAIGGTPGTLFVAGYFNSFDGVYFGTRFVKLPSKTTELFLWPLQACGSSTTDPNCFPP